ncbi:hypothetical protein PT974_02722 [Cladobotryum mycophilum]|uniref:Inhibitor I9 domain-containing protein n=1 Tax=Cladobotryum mycophilum TaxID=491253 RepID=A0ABR0T068_9HYPO
MKFLAYVATALAVVPAALAVDQKKSAIVWFDNDATPDSVVSKIRADIIKAGGKITHDYTIIRGFAVIAPEKALETVQALGVEHSIRVEEDEMVSTL